MGDFHDVLTAKASDIVWRVSNPAYIASVYLGQFFSKPEREKLECETKNEGDSKGTEALLTLMKKRKDAAVFNAFLDALAKESLADLADELKAESLRTRQDQQTEIRGCCEVSGQLHSESGKQVALGLDTPLRRLGQTIIGTITRLLGKPSNNDWRVIAGYMELTGEKVQEMEEEGKSAALMKIMYERDLKVRDLLRWLLKAQRFDVIDEMKTEGIVSDQDVRPNTYKETAV